jgi:hypothetical protein
VLEKSNVLMMYVWPLLSPPIIAKSFIAATSTLSWSVKHDGCGQTYKNTWQIVAITGRALRISSNSPTTCLSSVLLADSQWTHRYRKDTHGQDPRQDTGCTVCVSCQLHTQKAQAYHKDHAMLLHTPKQDVSTRTQVCLDLADMTDVGEDVENCVLRLLQAAEYDINRTE